MTAAQLVKQITFIKEIDKLKYIQRKTKLFNSDRNENDAEHSWHLALMAIVLAEHANEPVDILKVVKMVLIHDIVEIDAGDTFIYDTQKDHTNTEEERLAAGRIFGLLPKEQAEELIARSLRQVKQKKPVSQKPWTGWSHCCKIVPITVVPGMSPV
ncbi:HD family hydrolase [Terrimonas rubra]|uniref:HD family hydrolase n=1 Tax=Terrimonas rubra TaxID=1035890 RepID=A0ABW6A9E7_9BACT